MSANKRPSTSSLRRYLTSRPYIAVADIRRRFGLDPDAMSVVARNGTTAYIGLPEREAVKLQDLWQRDEVGVELSVEVHAPVIVGVYPMRIARFVVDHAHNGNGMAPHPPTAMPRADDPPQRTPAANQQGFDHSARDRRVRVAAVVSDLMMYSRIEAAATATGSSVVRVETPAALPEPATVDLVLVDWAARASGWEGALNDWCADATPASPRVILFGPHVDLEAHAAARTAGLGPMWARSRLLRELPRLVAQGG